MINRLFLGYFKAAYILNFQLIKSIVISILFNCLFIALYIHVLGTNKGEGGRKHSIAFFGVKCFI